MKKLILFTFCFQMVLLLVSCESSTVKDDSTDISYCYTIVNFKQPKLHSKKVVAGTAENDGITIHTIEWEYLSYLSDIVEVKGLTEDDKYKQMDNFDKSVRHGFNMYMVEYRYSINSANGISADQKQEFLNLKCEEIDRSVRVFKSYKEASESRQSVVNKL